MKPILTSLIMVISFIASPLLVADEASMIQTSAMDKKMTQPASQHDEKMEAQKIIIFLGAPGSGKGTQATKISKEQGIPHISTGDLFRENLKKETELGKKAKSYMDSGKLVPDEIVLDMVYKRISEPDSKKGYLLDGFPRNLHQAKEFEKKLPKHVKIVVINLNVKDEELIKRIVERGKASQVKRSDDTKEVAKKRLTIYQKETKPLVQYYKNKGWLVDIDGEKPQDQVHEEIQKGIENKS